MKHTISYFIMNGLTTSKLVLTAILLFFFSSVHSQHDHDHAHAHEAESEEVDMSDIPLPTSSEATSNIYEVLLKFQPVEPGEELTMDLFLSDANTNAPIDSAIIQITNTSLGDQVYEIEQEDRGTYHVHTTMRDEKLFDLNVSIQHARGNEVILLKEVDFQHHHAHDGMAEEHKHTAWWVFALGGLAILVIGILIGRSVANSRVRRQLSVLLIGICLIPSTQWNVISAHEGEDHGPAKKSNLIAGAFPVLKESQFLMGILTTRLGAGAFNNSRRLYGTIIPSSDGQAIVNSPQSGRMKAVHVKVGDQVKKGQLLAEIERIGDVASDVNFIAEKNRVNAEFESAKKEYERLEDLKDIASRKQLEEAKSRYDIATANRELYNSGSAKNIQLKSPIDGVVGTFTLNTGNSVNAEQTLFTITNLNRVFVEAQAYEKDVAQISTAQKFSVQCAEENHSTSDVSLISMGQEFNASNQSQRVIFSVNNSGNEFKLGEFVNVFAFSNSTEQAIALPNSAITELEGRAVVFVKKTAEQYELRYVALGDDNGIETIIHSGLAQGECVVTQGAYQVKLIYMNQ